MIRATPAKDCGAVCGVSVTPHWRGPCSPISGFASSCCRLRKSSPRACGGACSWIGRRTGRMSSNARKVARERLCVATKERAIRDHLADSRACAAIPRVEVTHRLEPLEQAHPRGLEHFEEVYVRHARSSATFHCARRCSGAVSGSATGSADRGARAAVVCVASTPTKTPTRTREPPSRRSATDPDTFALATGWITATMGMSMRIIHEKKASRGLPPTLQAGAGAIPLEDVGRLDEQPTNSFSAEHALRVVPIRCRAPGCTAPSRVCPLAT